uniref:TsaA-like domain-containing protein n=1 Tax=Chromera velia CCMP2878 TaxID=1169474 RepID=A0A0G4GJ21_9ALVE|eukprot:Cvel_22105.t1-p1 / transcript=Cvel_22105.t1 / gene=Cvel_22105 / organism=Chromera_velia_CCMP2878 / gene_product=Putative S-adenosylmethionine-dependent, putative / transcript_product=Putative S-adenosylmethionine-dependent, putative / location=Cvel_scaffold2140:16120-23163(-) / protein_length=643 / sequence_SO=supercontig / SO=protein_coding / is_pseudo=false
MEDRLRHLIREAFFEEQQAEAGVISADVTLQEDIVISRPKTPIYGDFSSNALIVCARKSCTSSDKGDLSAQWAQNGDDRLLFKCESRSRGFLNFFLLSSEEKEKGVGEAEAAEGDEEEEEGREGNKGNREETKGSTKTHEGGGVPGSSSSRLWTLRQIGSVRSCYREKFGTPRQGALCPDSRAVIELFPEIGEQSMDGLEDFSHVWVFFVFHLSLPAASARTTGREESQAVQDREKEGEEKAFSGVLSSHARVRPPKRDGKSTGVLATRAPHRPSSIGLSVCRIEWVSSRRLCVSAHDLIDGTPVLDLKPYHPLDGLPCVAALSLQVPPSEPWAPQGAIAASEGESPSHCTQPQEKDKDLHQPQPDEAKGNLKREALRAPSWLEKPLEPSSLMPVVFLEPALSSLVSLGRQALGRYVARLQRRKKLIVIEEEDEAKEEEGIRQEASEGSKEMDSSAKLHQHDAPSVSANAAAESDSAKTPAGSGSCREPRNPTKRDQHPISIHAAELDAALEGDPDPQGDSAVERSRRGDTTEDGRALSRLQKMDALMARLPMNADGGVPPFELLNSFASFLRLVRQTLGADPRSPQMKRQEYGEQHQVFLDTFEVLYRVRRGMVKVSKGGEESREKQEENESAEVLSISKAP